MKIAAFLFIQPITFTNICAHSLGFPSEMTKKAKVGRTRDTSYVRYRSLYSTFAFCHFRRKSHSNGLKRLPFSKRSRFFTQVVLVARNVFLDVAQDL